MLHNANTSIIILYELEYVPPSYNLVLFHHYQAKVWLYHQNQLCSRIGCTWMDGGTFLFSVLSEIKTPIEKFIILI